MSLALATKGVIAGIGWGTGASGEIISGPYPTGYIAASIGLDIDIGGPVIVVDNEQPVFDFTVPVTTIISAIGEVQVSVSLAEPAIEVEVCQTR